mmetsp:Transcript_8439/g.13790  ORF Transcript_8439/g.13790 Transcript_8439/m.13790 type:complete len:96 (-) Transcript_8439:51-338(-)
MDQVARDYLDAGLVKAQDLFQEEAEGKVSFSVRAGAGMLTALLICLMIVYIVIFRPMMKELKEECGRSSQLLKQLPYDVAKNIKGLRSYFEDTGM